MPEREEEKEQMACTEEILPLSDKPA